MFLCPTTTFLGYDKDADGNLIINEKQANTIRRIFKEFLSGNGTNKIALNLTKEKVKTGTGRTKWTGNAVYRMLRNEKYCGDILMQKRVTVDFLTHKRVINRGHQPQYFIADHHPAIISKDDWNAVQIELDRRYNMNKGDGDHPEQRHSNRSPFSNTLFCGKCGDPYIRRTFTTFKKSQKQLYGAWKCRVADGRKEGLECDGKTYREISIEHGFMDMLQKMKLEGGKLLEDANRAKTKWSSVSVRNILKNERYCGDIVAQKTFTKSYITHDHEVNKGQKQVYYSADHHESIISRDDYIQSLLLLSSNRNSNRLDVGYTLTVIKEGMLKGFVPINRAHGGYKVPHFVKASKSAYDDDAENRVAGAVFNLPGYEVARIQEFANGDKAKMTLSNKWLRFNTSCIRKMPNVEYVEILLHPIDRLIAVRPCSENNPNAILWKKVYKNRLQSTHVSSATFANLLYELMGWKDEWQIEIVANCKNRDQDSILLFDLKEPIFKVKKTKRITDESENTNEESESYTAKLLPGEWRDSFGKQMVEHAYSNMNHDEHNDRDWNISAEGIAVEGFEVKTKIKSEEDIKRQIEEMQN